MEKPTVLYIGPLGAHWTRLQPILEAHFSVSPLPEGPESEPWLTEKGHLFRGAVIFGPGARRRISGDFLDRLPNLEILANSSVGLDGLDVPIVKSRGVVVTNTPTAMVDSVAESAILLLLATVREVIPADRVVRDGLWSKSRRNKSTMQVSKKSVGIVGLGIIGSAIAKRMESFGCPVRYWGRKAKHKYPDYKFCDSLVELAQKSVFLIIACSLTDGTRKVVNREVLDSLGPQGYVVNIARGEVIDETELVKALVEGRIAGAGLDVFENEPEVPKELIGMQNVVLWPHNAFNTFECIQATIQEVLDNMKSHFAGLPAPGAVQ